MAQGHVHHDASVVDALVDVVVGELFGAQGAHSKAHSAHCAHVLLTVLNHLGHELRRVFKRWDAHQANELIASVILLH